MHLGQVFPLVRLTRNLMDHPTEPGTYWARDVAFDLMGNRILGMPCRVEIVEGVSNPRQHLLLVKTGLDRPRYRSLNCYEFGEPTARELVTLTMFANQQ